MFEFKSDGNITLTHFLIPFTLMALILMLLFAFQGNKVVEERNALYDVRTNQERAFQESQKLQDQVKALLVGTQQLTEKGNKNAKVITDRLKELGIIQTPAPEGEAASPAPVPAASETPERGPVKP